MATLSDRYDEARNKAKGSIDGYELNGFKKGADFPKETWIAMYEAMQNAKHYLVDFDAGHKFKSKPTKCQRAIRDFEKALAKAEKFLNGQQKEKD